MVNNSNQQNLDLSKASITKVGEARLRAAGLIHDFSRLYE